MAARETAGRNNVCGKARFIQAPGGRTLTKASIPQPRRAASFLGMAKQLTPGLWNLQGLLRSGGTL
jgi:hypothetical protein